MRNICNMDSQGANPFKIVLLGDEGVGKTALLVRFLCRRYLGEYDPTIEDSYSKKLIFDGKTSIIEVLDTAEKGLGTSRREDFMSTALAFVLVFSTTDAVSFRSVLNYKSTIDKYPGQSAVPVMLIGTKSDLTHLRQVPRNEAQSLAKLYGWQYSECSAAYDLNVQSIFQNIVKKIRKDKDSVSKVEKKTVTRKKSILNKLGFQFTRHRSYSKNISTSKEDPEHHLLKSNLCSTATNLSPPTSMPRRRSYSVTTLI